MNFIRLSDTSWKRYDRKQSSGLAYHFYQGDARDKALLYLDKAARKTQQEYANETALNYYNQALGLEERWAWRQGQVEVLHILGRRDQERASLEQLEAHPTAPIFETAYLWGGYYEVIGDYPQAQVAVERALAASQQQRDLLNEVRSLSQLGLIARRQGDYERAKTWCNQALDLFQNQKIFSDGEAQALAQTIDRLGTVYRQQGDFDQAQLCYEGALILSRQSSNRQHEAEILNNLGVTTYYRRDFAQALVFHQQALTIRQVIGDRAGEGISLYNLSMVTRDSGDYSQTQEYLSNALAIQQATGNRWEEVNVWNELGILYQELGDLDAAQTCLWQGLLVAEDIGDEEGQVYLLSNLGLVIRDQGELATAEEILSEGLSLTQTLNNEHQASFFLSYLSTVSLEAGQIEQAVERAQAALDLRNHLDLRLRTTDDLATLAAAHLAAADLAQALDYAHQTLTILQECGGEGPEFPQRDYLIAYRVLTAAGQIDEAQLALKSAYDLVMVRADKIIDPILRRSFLENVAVNQEIVAEAMQMLAAR